MTLPQPYRLEMYQGDSYAWEFRLWADVEKTTPIDVTGVTVTAQVRLHAGSPVLTTLATSVSANAITVTVTPAQSGALPELARWDLQLLYPAGQVQTIVTGEVRVHADITRAVVA